MDATQDYPHLSQWPRGALVPTHALLVQAYALLRAAGVSNNPEGTRDALALAAYLGGWWWPGQDNRPGGLRTAINAAMGGGTGSTRRNVITQPPPEGIRDSGLAVIRDRRVDGRKEFFAELTPEGRAAVAKYCKDRGISNPLVSARDVEVVRGDREAPNPPDGLPAAGPTRGPVPTTWSGPVSRDADAAATTYAFRFGKRDIWKIGYAQDLSDRLYEVNKHVPHEVLGERWSITTWQQRWPTQTEAYEMEQRLLSLLAARRTVGERVRCTEDELQTAWVCAGSRADGPAAKVASAGPLVSM